MWIGLGTTGTALAVAGLFGLRAHELHDEASALPTRHPERRSLKGDIEDAELIADVALVSAAVAALGTALLLWLEQEEENVAEGTPQLGASAGPDGVGLLLRGTL